MREGELMRLLIVAEDASATFGGEAVLPLHYFRLLRRRGVDVHLVVHARNRDALLRLFPHDAGRLHFVPDTWLHKGLVGDHLPSAVGAGAGDHGADAQSANAVADAAAGQTADP
ncbi:MAG: hypothetical protein ACK4PI_08265 [Tepidisphaerales bacterium]